MAAIVVTDVFLQQILSNLLNAGGGSLAVYYRLYTNNHSPAPGDGVADYSESSAPGYAVVSYSGGTWTISNVSSGDDKAENAAATYTFTGADTIYGYYVTDSSNANLYWAQLFDTPISLPSIGGVITFTPALHLATPL